jgi:hypothetical protein
MLGTRILLAGLGLLLVLHVGCGGSAPAPTEAWNAVATEQGHFRLTWSADIDPITINRIHTWTVSVEDREGRPVDGARVVVDGDMPEHQHGMPTEPEMTGQTGSGEYRIEGMKFSMPGLWEIEISVWAAGVTDHVTIPLTLE